MRFTIDIRALLWYNMSNCIVAGMKVRKRTFKLGLCERMILAMGKYTQKVPKGGSRKALSDVMTSRNEKRIKRKRFRVLAILLCAALCVGGITGGINLLMAKGEDNYIITQEQAAALQDVDCILVLGARVWANGTLSHMLEDRIRRGVSLYHADASPVLVASGDHGREDYDEVAAMKQYAVDNGVPSESVFMDHAGFSTYDSMYRIRDVFRAKKVIIVTQRYHMFRALYIARQLGLEAYGVTSDYRPYASQFRNSAREFLARFKDYFKCMAKPEPTYLGTPIPLDGDGNATNDEGVVF